MSHLPMRWLALLSVVGCGLALWLAPAWGKDATVTLNDGRQFTGEVVSDNVQGVELKISGINTPFKREDIKSLDYVKTIEEQYAERRATMADDDVNGRYELAHWLYENRAYPLAKREVDDLLRRFPDVEKLQKLSRDIDQKLKLQEEPRGAVKAPGRPIGRKPAENPNLPGVADELTDEQINLLRIYEVEPGDRPRVSVNPDAVNQLLTDYAADDDVPKGDADQQQFRLAPGWQQLQLMFKLKARKLYGQATVLDDPPLFAAFREINQRYVMNYCGTSRCHGGENAGKFFLFHSDSNTPRDYYTNYLILYNYQDPKGLGYMLDAKEPAKSYLIQYGLRQVDAAFPHPAVPGWQPRLHGPDDDTRRGIEAWTSRLPIPRQNYAKLGIDYTAPKPKAVVVDRAGAKPAPAAPLVAPAPLAPTTRESR